MSVTEKATSKTASSNTTTAKTATEYKKTDKQPNNFSERSSTTVSQSVVSSSTIYGNLNVEKIEQTTTVFNQTTDFFELDLKDFDLHELRTLKVSNELLSTVLKHHFVVIGDGGNIDKYALAKHVAATLSRRIEGKGKKTVVKRWSGSTDSGAIRFELDEYDVCKILILPKASHQSFQTYDLHDLQKTAAKSGHFVIVTTELPFKSWHLASTSKSWWRDLKDADAEGNQMLISDLSKEEFLRSWYYRKLSSREQMLAIGLSLFDGLFDDQFFAALEAIVDHVWKNRDVSLKALDYCDLDNLRTYFVFTTDTKNKRTLLEVRYPKQRLMCLKIAWESHRRQILSALPVIVDLIKKSENQMNGELYGSSMKRKNMQQVISRAISEVGLISRTGSQEAVEDSLLNLAASSDPRVQSVAAQSIALWRDDERKNVVLKDERDLDVDKELFSVLDNWQRETRINDLVALLLRDKAKQKSEKASDYIRSTLAITVAYASLHDAPGELPRKLYELFINLSKDSNHLVKKSFSSYTVPLFIGGHLETVKEVLPELVQDVDLIIPVAKSLAQTYQLQGKDVLSLLEEWRSNCEKNHAKVSSPRSIEKREALLATTALTYACFSYTQGLDGNDIDRVSIKTAYERLLDIYKHEQHPEIRKIVLSSIAILIEKDFGTLSAYLSDLISISSSKENGALLNALSNVYLAQRAALQGGERTVSIDNKTCPIWLNPEYRKTTVIEKSLLAWIKDDRNGERQKFAAQALMGFVRDFETKEAKKIEAIESSESRMREELLILQRPSTPRRPFVPQKLQDGVYISRFIPWLATRQSEAYRPSVSHILPETARQGILGAPRVDFLLNKMRKAKDGQLTGLSGSLSRAIWWSKYFKPIAFASGVVCFIAFFWVSAFIEEQRYRQSYGDVYEREVPAISDPEPNLPPTPPAADLPVQAPSNSGTSSPPPQNRNVVYGRIVGSNAPDVRLKNVRAGITTSDRVLFELPVGSRIEILGSQRNADNFLWYRIYSPDEDAEGWIASHLVSVE